MSGVETGRFETTSDRRRDRLVKLALVVGYASLTVALVVAHEAPANDYEVSIYLATPLAFWIGAGLAIGLSLVAALATHRRDLTRFGLLLGGSGTLSIASLPVIRDYWFHGFGDALTHLGWARELAAGTIGPLALPYPGSHLTAIAFEQVTGFPLRRAMLLVVVVTVAAYLLFVPLVVRTLVPDRLAVVLGAVSGFLLLPVTLVSTYLQFHPFTMAAFLSPLVLYLFFRFLGLGRDSARESGHDRRLDARSLDVDRSASGVLLVVAYTALLLFHPQLTFDVLLVFVAVAGVQFVARRYRPEGTIAGHRPAYGVVAVFVVLFVVWVVQFDKTVSTVDAIIAATVGFANGTDQAGEIVTQRSGSLADAGLSIEAMLFRLFAVRLVYVALAGLLMVLALARRLGHEYPERDAAITYVAASGVLLVPFFALHFVGNVSTYFFRHIGFAMVLATILGALALHVGASRLFAVARRHRGGVALSAAVPAVLLTFLALSAATFYFSPYTAEATQHVSANEAVGYQLAFDHRAPGVPFDGVRSTPYRFVQALSAGSVVTGDAVPALTLAGNLTAVGSPQYLAVTSADYQREVFAYHSVAYSAANFAALDAQPGVDRVQSNDDFALYYVEARPSSAGSPAATVEQRTTTAGRGAVSA